MGIKVTVSGNRTASRKLHAVADNARDVSAAWPKVSAYLTRVVRLQFSSKGAYLGRPWRPLKPEYKLWKMRHGFPGSQILVQTGAMRASFATMEQGPNFLRFGSAEQKAIWHQYGTHHNGKRVNPPRPMLIVTAMVREDVADIIKREVLG